MSIFNPLFKWLKFGVDYSRVKNLEAEILAVLRKQPPGFNVQIPLKDENGPLPIHVTIAVERLLEKHPELQALRFGASITICGGSNLRAQIGPDDMPDLEHFEQAKRR